MHNFSDITPVEVAAAASLLSDVARAAIVFTLLDGRARTASELAFVAGVTPQTASGHLAKLVDAGLISVLAQGRHRYHRLANPEAAQALEALTVLAAVPHRRPRVPGPRDTALREARTCYDHFAGRLGVAIADALVANGALIAEGRDFRITADGEQRLVGVGVDLAALRSQRRPLCRACLDWSERRPHLSGAVASRLMAHCLDAGWVTRLPGSRAVRVTPNGERQLGVTLGLNLRLPQAA
jgi:DNA-binding transcriptional ArsR family regulator